MRVLTPVAFTAYAGLLLMNQKAIIAIKTAIAQIPIPET
jgi:hypothetical protein